MILDYFYCVGTGKLSNTKCELLGQLLLLLFIDLKMSSTYNDYNHNNYTRW